jgi:TfoX/Sxy family transcriptional regulator of competence genes
MTYDEVLARRVRKSIAGRGRIREMEAFGGVMFMLDDKMCVGVSKDRLMVRVDPSRHEVLSKRPGAQPMDFTGRPMRGFLFIDAGALSDGRTLSSWVGEAVSYVRTVKKKPKRGSAPAAQARRPTRAPQRSRPKSRRS